MFTIVQRVGAIPRAPARHGHHHDRSAGSVAAPAAETGATNAGPFASLLARARSARLLTEGL